MTKRRFATVLTLNTIAIAVAVGLYWRLSLPSPELATMPTPPPDQVDRASHPTTPLQAATPPATQRAVPHGQAVPMRLRPRHHDAASGEVAPHRSGILLARFPGGAAGAQARAAELHSRFGITIEQQLHGAVELSVLRLPTGSHAPEMAQALERAGIVEYAEPDYLIHTQQQPDDSLFQYLWAHRNSGQSLPSSVNNGSVATSGQGTTDADMDTAEAWDISTGSASVVLAVLDTGGQLDHEDLRGNLWVNPGDSSYDGIDNDGNGYVDDVHGADCTGSQTRRSAPGSGLPWDEDSHGSHVAGIAGAVGGNAKGVVGVNQRLSIMVLRFIGIYSGSTLDAIACLEYLVAMVDRGIPVRVVNNSWGGANFQRSLYDAIKALEQRGVLFVAAAGNQNDNLAVEPSYPASYADPLYARGYDAPYPVGEPLNNVLSVAASDPNDGRASFSSYGSNVVRIAAPGTKILSLNHQAPEDSLSTVITLSDGSSLLGWESSGVNTASIDGDDYFNKTTAEFYLHSPKFDLSSFVGNSQVVLRMRMRCGGFQIDAMGDGDRLRIALSADTDGDGSSGLNRLSQDSYIATDSDDAYIYLLRNVKYWLTCGDDWRVAHLIIPATYFVDGAQLAITGTSVGNNGLTSNGGVDIDHISIGAVADRTATGYQVLQGTSMAAPQVAGAAALALSLRPAMAATELIHRITETADRIPNLGDIVSGGSHYIPRLGDSFYDNMSIGGDSWDAALSDFGNEPEGWHIASDTLLGHKHYFWQLSPVALPVNQVRSQYHFALVSHHFDLSGLNTVAFRTTVLSADFPDNHSTLRAYIRDSAGNEQPLGSTVTLSQAGTDDVIEDAIPMNALQNDQRLVFRVILSNNFDLLVNAAGLQPALRLYEIGVGDSTLQEVEGGQRLNVQRLLQKVSEAPLTPDMDNHWDADDFVIGLRILSGFESVDLAHNIELPATATPDLVLGLGNAMLADSALDVNGDSRQDGDDLRLILRQLSGAPAALLGGAGASLAGRDAQAVMAAIDHFLAH